MAFASDEDINTIVTPTAPTATSTGPITRARAIQLNYKVLSFLGNDSNVHEKTPIVSSYILGDFDAFHTLHDSHNCLHHMHFMNNALHISHDALHNLSLHYALHNNKPIMMDDMFLYHASHLFEH